MLTFIPNKQGNKWQQATRWDRYKTFIGTAWNHRAKARWSMWTVAALVAIWILFFRILIPASQGISTTTKNNPYTGIFILLGLLAIFAFFVTGIFLTVKYFLPIVTGKAWPKAKPAVPATVVEVKNVEAKSEGRGFLGWLGTSIKWVLITLFVVFIVGPFVVRVTRSAIASAKEIETTGSRGTTAILPLRWCKNDSSLDYRKRDRETIVLTADGSGCYEGKFMAPKNWDHILVEKSQNPGDQISIWCDGRNTPSRIYRDREAEFDLIDIEQCGSGPGDESMTFRFQGTKGSSITLHPVSKRMGIS